MSLFIRNQTGGGDGTQPGRKHLGPPSLPGDPPSCPGNRCEWGSQGRLGRRTRAQGPRLAGEFVEKGPGVGTLNLHAAQRPPREPPYLRLGLRRVFYIQVLSCLFHLLVGFLTQVLRLRSDFFWGENKEGLVTWTMTSAYAPYECATSRMEQGQRK